MIPSGAAGGALPVRAEPRRGLGAFSGLPLEEGEDDGIDLSFVSGDTRSSATRRGTTTSLDGPSTGTTDDWQGIYLISAETAEVEHAVIRYAGASGFAGLTMTGDASNGRFASVNAVRVEHTGDDGFVLDDLTSDATNLVAFQNDLKGFDVDGSFDLVHASSVGNLTSGIDATTHTGQIVNAISWGNTLNYTGVSSGDLVSCNGDAGLAGSNGNINVDPAFVDEAGGDLDLSAASLCVDAGNFAAALAIVLDHVENSRLLDPTLSGFLQADMGAYERSRWTVDFDGIARVGGRLRYTVDGPAGTSNVYLSLLDGETFVDPFGFLAAGTGSLSLAGIAPVGTAVAVDVPRSPALIGVEIGAQSQTTHSGDPSVGGTTLLARVTLRALESCSDQPTSL